MAAVPQQPVTVTARIKSQRMALGPGLLPMKRGFLMPPPPAMFASLSICFLLAMFTSAWMVASSSTTCCSQSLLIEHSEAWSTNILGPANIRVAHVVFAVSSMVPKYLDQSLAGHTQS